MERLPTVQAQGEEDKGASTLWRQRMLDQRRVWERKPLLRRAYEPLFERVRAHLTHTAPGNVIEIGAGAGAFASHFPQAIATDLFAAPWLDAVADAYHLPFQSASVANLVLVDVFHHLKFPMAFLQEAHRVLVDQGRVILGEPFISWIGALAYGGVHFEPVAWRDAIHQACDVLDHPGDYAAQGNATRLFFRNELPLPEGWRLAHREAFAGFAYLLSGGFSWPALYPNRLYPLLDRLDRWLSRRPRLFAARCVVVLEKARL